VDCSTYSPGHLPRVICVTASDIEDKDGGANYGSTIGVYAPGLYITSADFKSDDGHWAAEGTSMVCMLTSKTFSFTSGLG
jgi:hypothetical protein